MVKEKVIVLYNITFVFSLKFRLITGLDSNPTGIYLFKVNNGNTRTMCEQLFKVNNKDNRMTSSDVFIVNFEQISHINLLFPLLTLNK